MGIKTTLSTLAEKISNVSTFPIILTLEDCRGNAFTYSNDFSNGAWSLNESVTVSSTTETAPTGAATACILVYPGTDAGESVSRTFSCTIGDDVYCSVYLWTSSGEKTLYLSLVENSDWNTATIQAVTATTNPSRFSVNRKVTSASCAFYIGGDATNIPTAGNCYAWGAQKETGSLGPYYSTSASAMSPANAVQVKSARIAVFKQGAASEVTAVVNSMHRTASEGKFTIPLLGTAVAGGSCTVYETGLASNDTMYEWLDVKAYVEVDDAVVHSSTCVQSYESDALILAITSEYTAEHSGVLDFSKLENSGNIYL